MSQKAHQKKENISNKAPSYYTSHSLEKGPDPVYVLLDDDCKVIATEDIVTIEGSSDDDTKPSDGQPLHYPQRLHKHSQVSQTRKPDPETWLAEMLDDQDTQAKVIPFPGLPRNDFGEDGSLKGVIRKTPTKGNQTSLLEKRANLDRSDASRGSKAIVKGDEDSESEEVILVDDHFPKGSLLRQERPFKDTWMVGEDDVFVTEGDEEYMLLEDDKESKPVVAYLGSYRKRRIRQSQDPAPVFTEAEVKREPEPSREVTDIIPKETKKVSTNEQVEGKGTDPNLQSDSRQGTDPKAATITHEHVSSAMNDLPEQPDTLSGLDQVAKSGQVRPDQDADAFTKEKIETKTTPKLQDKKKEDKDKEAKDNDKALVSPMRKAKYSIRFKLITIISVLIASSLSLIIFLASYFFKDDTEIRIKANTLNLSKVIALKAQSDMVSLAKNARMLALSLIMEEDSQGDVFSKVFIENDEDILFLAIAEAQDQGVRYIKKVFNPNLLLANQISESDVDAINSQYSELYYQSIFGTTKIENLSPQYKFPVISLSHPLDNQAAAEPQILVMHVKLDKILKAFERSDITESFMVNDQGNIIAHSNQEQVLSRHNIIDMPIIKKMMKSAMDNGYDEFLDQNNVKLIGSFYKIGYANLGVVSLVEEQKAFEAVYRIQMRNLYILLILTNLTILIVYFFAKTLSSPIQRLVHATNSIEKGDYDIDIRATSRDEIGVLTDSFARMSVGLREREHIKEAFGKFVNKELAEKALSGDIKLGGEKREAAIFFSDIRGFTAISEALLPEEVVGFLNEYMTAMVKCVNDTKGIVDKFIGDAIMAHWGAIETLPNNTQAAVDSALMMRQALIEFNVGRGGTKKPIIKFGCGINTGPVIAGQIGSEERLEYTVIGDAVNLASRVETLNKPLGTDILISQDSYDRVKDLYWVEEMPPIKVKGKSEAQSLYAVLGHKSDPNSPRSMDEVREMVGIEYKKKQGSVDLEEKEEKYEILNK